MPEVADEVAGSVETKRKRGRPPGPSPESEYAKFVKSALIALINARGFDAIGPDLLAAVESSIPKAYQAAQRLIRRGPRDSE
jgi:hypothetical protein